MRYNTGQINFDFTDQAPPANGKLTYGEFFAGGLGCASAAKKNPKIEVRWVLNHDKIAINTATFHLPGVKTYHADIYNQDEHDLEPVHWIQASFECDYHTEASAGQEIDVPSYMMGWELYRYAKYLLPLLLTVENVPGVKKWAPLDENNQRIKEREGEEFERWKAAMMALGYQYTESIRCAADDGIPTTRTRYFAAFYREGIDVDFPEYTHNEFGTEGKEAWLPCKNYIDLDNHGHSIFGREFNIKIRKQHRRPLVKNSLRRIGGGIPKQAPEFHQFLCTYYGGEQGIKRNSSLDKPLPTQTADGNRHQLVTIEKMQFIADHCKVDFWQSVDDPLRPQLTWQTKQLVTVETKQYIDDHCHSDNFQSLDDPLNPQTSQQTKRLVTVDQYIAQYYGGSDQTQGLDSPLNTVPCRDIHQLVTIEKAQFIAHYFNSGGKPENNVQSIEKPIKSLTCNSQAQLVTLLYDFDIKVRFLSAEELAEISTFPRDFFNRPGFKVSHKNAIKMIGNAVPPEWFTKVILEPNIDTVLNYINRQESA
jgi:DNA (cytosine-5)-methyltransferase 1